MIPTINYSVPHPYWQKQTKQRRNQYQNYQMVKNFAPCVAFNNDFSQNDIGKKFILQQTKHINQNHPQPYNLREKLIEKGYMYVSKISETLQGEVFRAKIINSHNGYSNYFRKYRKNVVIKATNRKLHSKAIAVRNGTEIKIYENIEREIRILKYLSCCTNGNQNLNQLYMSRYIDSFADEKNIILVQEDCEMPFFDFVSQCHNLIQIGALPISEYQRIIKILFKQMATFINWLHNEMNVCHLDISLENLQILNVSKVFVAAKVNTVYFGDDVKLQIKFIDFGLAKIFDGKDFRCTQYAGKRGYKAPKVYATETFDARAADVWSLGVVLFKMMLNCAPYQTPCYTDSMFNYIINGHMNLLLTAWKRMNYINEQILDLLNKMLTSENKRIKSEQIQQHIWLQ